MKFLSVCLSMSLVAIAFTSCKVETKNVPAQKIGVNEYLGPWTIDMKGVAIGSSVGWLEVRQEDGYLDADLLWGGGWSSPVANIYMVNDRNLIVTRTSNIVRKMDENKNPVRTQVVTSWMEITKNGDKIEGILLTPRRNGLGVDSITFTGTKLPDVTPAPDLSAVKFGKPITLFNGKDMTGWRLIDEKSKNFFSVIDGALVNSPPVQVEGQPRIKIGNIRTDGVFEDFNLKLDVYVPKKGNSGIFLRGMYEVQVLDSYKMGPEFHNMGEVYGRIEPSVYVEKPAEIWQTFDITLCDRHITVILNGIKIIDNQPICGPTGGAIISDVFSPGPIMLQGDYGGASFRHIVLTPIIK
jgi:hypothetical protein